MPIFSFITFECLFLPIMSEGDNLDIPKYYDKNKVSLTHLAVKQQL